MVAHQQLQWHVQNRKTISQVIKGFRLTPMGKITRDHAQVCISMVLIDIRQTAFKTQHSDRGHKASAQGAQNGDLLSESVS